MYHQMTVYTYYYYYLQALMGEICIRERMHFFFVGTDVFLNGRTADTSTLSGAFASSQGFFFHYSRTGGTDHHRFWRSLASGHLRSSSQVRSSASSLKVVAPWLVF